MGSATYIMRDFTRRNPPEFYGSEVEKVPQEFINEVYKVLMMMVVMLVGKAELSTYQHNYVAQTVSTNGKNGD